MPVFCSDVAPTWIYQVDEGSFFANRDYLKMSVDSEANLIWVKAMTGGPTADASYTVTINAVSPAGTTKSFSVVINITGCKTVPIIPSTLID